MGEATTSNRQAEGTGRLLHIGSGAKVLEGWVNIDINDHPGVDVVADVTEGLDFVDAKAIFAEHFLEHLPLEKAIAFLLEVHRVLGRGGWLRLSTPNLEWVWQTHYKMDDNAGVKQMKTLGINRAFRGWGHKFVWSPALLQEALHSCGFRKLRWCGYGKSRKRFFRDLERHEPSFDLPGAPHVIIVEAKKGPPQPERLEAFNAFLTEHFLGHLDW